MSWSGTIFKQEYIENAALPSQVFNMTFSKDKVNLLSCHLFGLQLTGIFAMCQLLIAALYGYLHLVRIHI